jgi:hypothetical protein
MDDKLLHEKLSSLSLVPSREICDKVKGIYRKLLAKLPMGALGKAEASRPIIAIEIACRLLNVTVSREKLVQTCIVGQSEYVRLLNTCKIAIGVTWSGSNVEQILSLQFSTELVQESCKILDLYHSVYVSKLPAEARRYVNIDSALYKCAAFCVAAGAAQNQVVAGYSAVLKSG